MVIKVQLQKVIAMCANSNAENADLKSVDGPPTVQDDVVQQQDARATDDKPKTADVVPPKKRKTRRGKTKRRSYPYIKNYRKSNKVIKPEAPHNSNQFLLEDHGNIEELDQKLKCINDPASSSTITRTRDSSFSVDTVDSEADGDDFYSSPDDDKEFLIKDFDDQYETLHAERLYAMTKNELIQEYLSLESKVEELTKQLLEKSANGDADSNRLDLQSEVERLRLENERLRCENSELKSKISVSCSSDSADSETDSSDSCSSSSSSMSRSPSPVDYSQTNGHSPSLEQSV